MSSLHAMTEWRTSDVSCLHIVTEGATSVTSLHVVTEGRTSDVICLQVVTEGISLM